MPNPIQMNRPNPTTPMSAPYPVGEESAVAGERIGIGNSCAKSVQVNTDPSAAALNVSPPEGPRAGIARHPEPRCLLRQARPTILAS